MPNFNDPKHWYDRGAEMRVLADQMSNEEAKTTMLRLAEDYDRLGDRALDRTNAEQKKLNAERKRRK